MRASNTQAIGPGSEKSGSGFSNGAAVIQVEGHNGGLKAYAMRANHRAEQPDLMH